jgi:hypothetical protein
MRELKRNICIDGLGLFPIHRARNATVDNHMIAVLKKVLNMYFWTPLTRETKYGIPTAFIQGSYEVKMVLIKL